MTSTNPAKGFKVVVGIIMAAVLVFCAITVEPPWDRRKHLIDQEIISNIAMIAEKLQKIKNNGQALPESLESMDCKPNEWAHYNPIKDKDIKGCFMPEITYERLGDDAVKFCATYLLPGPRKLEELDSKSSYNIPYRTEFGQKALDPLIAHPAGHFCFRAKFDAEEKHK